jgi:hypothetical protein
MVAVEGERDRRWEPSASSGAGDTDRFGDAVEGHGFDEVDFGAGERRDLGAVVVLGVLRGDGVVERVRVAAGPHNSHVHERWEFGPVRFADLAEEADRSELHVLERVTRVADEASPVGARPVVEAAHQCAETMLGGRVEVAGVHPAELGDRCGLVEEREHGELGEFEPVLVHDLGFLTAFGQVVEPGHCFRESSQRHLRQVVVEIAAIAWWVTLLESLSDSPRTTTSSAEITAHFSSSPDGFAAGIRGIRGIVDWKLELRTQPCASGLLGSPQSRNGQAVRMRCVPS